jgi:DNA repair photolyase
MNAGIHPSISIGRPKSVSDPLVFDAQSEQLKTVRKGRGAVTNPANRFDSEVTSPFDDGWDTIPAELQDMPPLPTELIRDTTRGIISYNQSPDIGFDRSVNPYLGYSPGLDFETKIVFKPEAAALLEKALSKPGYVPQPLALGTNTDPYQPVERTLKLTRAVLEVLSRFNHPATIVTKSAGVLRDLDILQSMAERNLVRVYLSVTTLDADLARRMEPRAATPVRRLQAVAELAQAKIPAGVLAAPMIPGLNDSELESILAAAAQAKASHAGYVLLRLPLEVAKIFEDWLRLHYPDRAQHVLSLVRQTRGGALYDSSFGQRLSGSGVYADLLAKRFERAARQLNLLERRALDCSRFSPPVKTPGGLQLSLL